MGRKNDRRQDFVPLDLTPSDVRMGAPRQSGTGDDEATSYERREAARERERTRAEVQRQARISRGIDWNICVVPGCGESLVVFGVSDHPDPRRRDPSMELPVCYRHAGVLWRQLTRLHVRDDRFIEAIADVNAKVAERESRIHADEQALHMQRQDGDIYFVRIGDLVKVGWTRDLEKRLKQYGASAQLLVCYDATRDDETNLHRQLTPARAKGREWYHDGDVIQRFIDEALARYGRPPTFDDMWTKPKQVVAGKRAMRYR